MKKWHPRYLRYAVLLSAIVFTILCRFKSEVGEWYVLTVYPYWSASISFLTSWISFSLEEIVVSAVLLFLVGYTIYARYRKKKWKQILLVQSEMLAWVYVWFYFGWGMTYFRASFHERTGMVPVAYQKEEFKAFLDDYVLRLNAAFTEEDTLPFERQEDAIKQIYASLPKHYGLTKPYRFQHPKSVFFNSLYSAVGVKGFMGPFFAESQLNEQLLPIEYPFVYAHELAHLLGVSHEAEANFWAYHICIRSEDAFVRYSGYMGVLSYILWDAQAALSPTEYRDFTDRIHPSAWRMLEQRIEHWQGLYSPVAGKIQSLIYDWFLQSHRMPEGLQSYGEVVGLMMSEYHTRMSR